VSSEYAKGRACNSGSLRFASFQLAPNDVYLKHRACLAMPSEYVLTAANRDIKNPLSEISCGIDSDE